MSLAHYGPLKAELDGYHASGSTALVDHSLRLPSSIYRAPERLAAEVRHLFDRSPIVAGCSSEVNEPHAYLARTVVGTSLLLVRQPDGGLRAFLNACRHRGVEVVAGPQAGCARRFACRYHGWTYGEDGTLVGFPGRPSFDDVDPAELNLQEVSCAERHGLIFVNRRPGPAIDLDAFLGPMDAELAGAGVANFVAERRVDLEVDANWKLLMDGYLETYHVRFLHAESLRDIVWPDRSAYSPFGVHGRHVVARRNYDPASHQSDDDLMAQLSMALRLFPNTVVTWFSDHFEMWQLEPDLTRPNRTSVRLTMLVPPETVGNTSKWDRNTKISVGVITGEDFSTAVSAQQMLDGGTAPDCFRYGRNEPGVQHFHQTLVAALADAVK